MVTSELKRHECNVLFISFIESLKLCNFDHPHYLRILMNHVAHSPAHYIHLYTMHCSSSLLMLDKVMLDAQFQNIHGHDNLKVMK